MTPPLFLLSAKVECRPPGPGTFLKLKPFDLKRFYRCSNDCRSISLLTLRTTNTLIPKHENQQYPVGATDPKSTEYKEDEDQMQVESKREVPLIQAAHIVQSAHHCEFEIAVCSNISDPVLERALGIKKFGSEVDGDRSETARTAENEEDEKKIDRINGTNHLQDVSPTQAVIDVEVEEKMAIDQEHEKDSGSVTECHRLQQENSYRGIDFDVSTKTFGNVKDEKEDDDMDFTPKVNIPGLSMLQTGSGGGGYRDSMITGGCLCPQTPPISPAMGGDIDEADLADVDEDDEINFITESPPPPAALLQPVTQQGHVTLAPIVRKMAQPVSWRARLHKLQAQQSHIQQIDSPIFDLGTGKEVSIRNFASQQVQPLSPPFSHDASGSGSSAASANSQPLSPESDEVFTFSANSAEEFPDVSELSTEGYYPAVFTPSETESHQGSATCQVEKVAAESSIRSYLSQRSVEEVAAWIERSDFNSPNSSSSSSIGSATAAYVSKSGSGLAKQQRKKANRKARKANEASQVEIEQKTEAERQSKEEAKKKFRTLKKTKQKEKGRGRKAEATGRGLGHANPEGINTLKQKEKIKSGKEKRQVGYLFG